MYESYLTIFVPTAKHTLVFSFTLGYVLCNFGKACYFTVDKETEETEQQECNNKQTTACLKGLKNTHNSNLRHFIVHNFRREKVQTVDTGNFLVCMSQPHVFAKTSGYVLGNIG